MLISEVTLLSVGDVKELDTEIKDRGEFVGDGERICRQRKTQVRQVSQQPLLQLWIRGLRRLLLRCGRS